MKKLHMNYTTHDRETVNEARATYREALRALESAYRETIDGTPAETIKSAVLRFSAARGISEKNAAPMVFAVLASVVSDCAWDGRISARSANWADGVPGCLDGPTLSLFGIYTNIHRTHLDQLARAAGNYFPLSVAE